MGGRRGPEVAPPEQVQTAGAQSQERRGQRPVPRTRPLWGPSPDHGPRTTGIATKIKEATEMLPGFGSSGFRDMQMDNRNNALGVKLLKEAGVNVTPRQLEVYWGNTCQQSCIYCDAHYSSTIQQEEKRFGDFDTEGVEISDRWKKNPKIEEHTELLFKWFEKHLHKLHKIFVMGGEPFLQKETFRFIEFLEKGSYPDLTLVFFSNHNIEHERFKKWMDRLEVLQKSGRLDKIQIFFSCDALGKEGEYVRTGLDLNVALKNFEYILHNTSFDQGINSALTVTAVPGMPAMVKYINECSKIKPIYWSMMKANQYEIGPREYMYPGIFGSKINDWGLREAVEMFDTNSYGHPDSVKVNHKKFMEGNIKEFESRDPNPIRMKQFNIYLKELDRRRGTDWTKIYPQMYKEIKNL